jgi:hypothetical protein
MATSSLEVAPPPALGRDPQGVTERWVESLRLFGVGAERSSRPRRSTPAKQVGSRPLLLGRGQVGCPLGIGECVSES